MFEIGDIVEITAEADATGMLDFAKGRGYTVLETAYSTTNLTEPVKVYYLKIRVMNESGVERWYTASHFKLKKEAKVEKKECLFKAGQVVWDLRNGRGVVVETADDGRYPVIVEFDLKDADGYKVIDSYTADGRFAITQNIRSLYFSEPKIEAATEPLFEPVLEKGQPIILTHFGAEVQMVAGWVNEERQNEIEIMTEHGFSTTYSKDKWTVHSVGEKIEFN